MKALLITPLIVLALWINGNLLVFTSRPVQVCIGWADDTRYSWWCTPDYTARRLRETEQAVVDAQYDAWAWEQSARHFENLYNDSN